MVRFARTSHVRHGLMFFLLTVLSAVVGAETEEAAWGALKSGDAILLMRHALAPGTGDPANFELGDCSTQRNLNTAGREQARAWGRLLAEHGVQEARVYTSAWCRTRDTADLLAPGAVTVQSSLNSFFSGRGDADKQTRQTLEWVNGLGDGAPVVLVSHQVNITRLTGVYPDSGVGLILPLPLQIGSSPLARISP